MEEKLTPQLTMTAGFQITNKPSFLHEQKENKPKQFMEFRNFSLQVGLFKRYGQSLARSGSNYDETIRKQIFGDVIAKRGIMLELTKRAANMQLVQTSVFTPCNVKAKVTGGVKATKNKVYFNTKSILKWKFPG